MAYITLDDLKDYLGVDRSDDDILLQDFIDRTVAIIEAPPPLGTGRKFEAYTATKYFTRDDVDGRSLYLFYDDLLSITTLTNGDGTTIDAASYRLLPRNFGPPYWEIKLLWDSGVYWVFYNSDSEIGVAGTWGYSSTAPEPIQQMALRIASWLYRQKDTSQEQTQQLATNGVALIPARLPRDIYDLIVTYRRKV